MCKCTLPKGLVIKPDGVHELAPGLFETEQVLTNCTVETMERQQIHKTNNRRLSFRHFF